jgi:hypothetical protein
MEQLELPFLGKQDALNDAIMSAKMYLKLQTMDEYKGAFSKTKPQWTESP